MTAMRRRLISMRSWRLVTGGVVLFGALALDTADAAPPVTYNVLTAEATASASVSLGDDVYLGSFGFALTHDVPVQLGHDLARYQTRLPVVFTALVSHQLAHSNSSTTILRFV